MKKPATQTQCLIHFPFIKLTLLLILLPVCAEGFTSTLFKITDFLNKGMDDVMDMVATYAEATQEGLILMWLNLLPDILTRNVMKSRHDWKCLDSMYSRKLGMYERFMYMRWPDHSYGGSKDSFYDRLVFIHHEGRYDYVLSNYWTSSHKDFSISVTGVIISSHQVLTSLNPFRQIIRWKFKMYFTSICTLHLRRYHYWDGDNVYYRGEYYDSACARPVVPHNEEDIAQANWQGLNDHKRIHTPVHDLMVIRTDYRFKYMKTWHTKVYDWYNAGWNWFAVGPIKTRLAEPNDKLDKKISYCMSGHVLTNNRVLKRNSMVQVHGSETDNVLTECDGWIPREWGWFICVRNEHNIGRLTSGAMLFSLNALYGVGSFALFKGNFSVLVFTDVRKYYHLIFNTCSHADQNLIVPVTTITTTSTPKPSPTPREPRYNPWKWG